MLGDQVTLLIEHDKSRFGFDVYGIGCPVFFHEGHFTKKNERVYSEGYEVLVQNDPFFSGKVIGGSWFVALARHFADWR